MKHVIFDLDGTLIDTLPGISHAMNRVLTEFGLEERPEEYFRSHIGGGIDRTIRTLFSDFDEEGCQLCRSCFDHEYSRVIKTMSRLFDGVEAMLEDFSYRGYGLSILSNKSQKFVDSIVSHFFDGYRFEAVVGVTDSTIMKPHAEFTNRLINQIACLDRSSVLLIGDTKFDMEAARNANIVAIGAGWGYGKAGELLQHGASIVASTPKLLSNIVTKYDYSQPPEGRLAESR